MFKQIEIHIKKIYDKICLQTKKIIIAFCARSLFFFAGINAIGYFHSQMIPMSLTNPQAMMKIKYKRKEWKTNKVDQSLLLSPKLSGSYPEKCRKRMRLRDFILFERNLTQSQWNKSCRILHGQWYDPYNDKMIFNAKALDVEHLLPVYRMHQDGGHVRKMSEKHSMYAYPDNLFLVLRKTNRHKGSKNITTWIPPSKLFWHAYALHWRSFKKNWNLDMDSNEKFAIQWLSAQGMQTLLHGNQFGEINYIQFILEASILARRQLLYIAGLGVSS